MHIYMVFFFVTDTDIASYADHTTPYSTVYDASDVIRKLELASSSYSNGLMTTL